MPVPSYEALMPLVLARSTTEQQIRDAVTSIADELGLNEDERSQTIPSGQTTLVSSRVTWAVTYLVQAGLLTRPKRGHFVITEQGRSVLENDLQLLDLAYLKQIPEFVEFLTRKNEGSAQRNGTANLEIQQGKESPEEIIGGAYEELQTDLKEQILERILQNSPAFFENLVVRLLSSLGYGRSDTLAEVMGKVGDGGIDGIIHQDKLGLDVVYVQAKRYAPQNAVGRPEL